VNKEEMLRFCDHFAYRVGASMNVRTEITVLQALKIIVCALEDAARKQRLHDAHAEAKLQAYHLKLREEEQI
jgi:hypothetical protein